MHYRPGTILRYKDPEFDFSVKIIDGSFGVVVKSKISYRYIGEQSYWSYYEAPNHWMVDKEYTVNRLLERVDNLAKSNG